MQKTTGEPAGGRENRRRKEKRQETPRWLRTDRKILYSGGRGTDWLAAMTYKNIVLRNDKHRFKQQSKELRSECIDINSHGGWCRASLADSLRSVAIRSSVSV